MKLIEKIKSLPGRTVQISILIVVVLVLLLSYYFYIINKSNTTNTMYISPERLEQAKKSYHEGDYQTARTNFEDILRIPMSKDQEAIIKNFYAGALFASDQEEDKIKGVEMMKSIVRDPEMSPVSKMFAYNAIAAVFVKNSSRYSYLKYFNDEPFAGFLPKEAPGNSGVSDVDMAYVKILELSNEVYPNSYANYVIAGDYYAPILGRHANASTTEKELSSAENQARMVQDLIKKGDALSSDESLFAPATYIWAKLNKAIALRATNRILNNLTDEEVENAFKDVYSLGLEEKNDNANSQFTMFKVRFFYANFLSAELPETSNRIAELLAPFDKAALGEDVASKNIRSFFTRTSQNASHPVNVISRRLAPHSPEFKKFLENTGYAF